MQLSPLRLAALIVAASLAPPAPAAAQDDPLADRQWPLSPEAVIQLPPAWKLSSGTGVVVAVVDSGCSVGHPDLAPRLWTNRDERAGNGMDDDRNGYVDDVHGVDLTTTRTGQNLSDPVGHGTHVAGIVAAAANGRGVVGAAFRTQIMVVRVLDRRGRGTTDGVAEGIRYAARNGAKVINLSLGGPDTSPALNDAIAQANASGALVTAAAGNEGRNVDRRAQFPASIGGPNLVGVAATAPPDGRRLADFSNYGRRTIQLAAPGEEVLSTAGRGGYALRSGTSMAAPHAAGVAALMAAVKRDATASDLRTQLLRTARRSSLPVQAGYVDAVRAVVQVAREPSDALGKRLLLRVLSATAARTRNAVVLRAQIAALGDTRRVARYILSVDGRRIATAARRGTPFNVRLTIHARRLPRRVSVTAVDSARRVLGRASARVLKVSPGKGGVGRGPGIGAP
jgi:subtilisin family serine protease